MRLVRPTTARPRAEAAQPEVPSSSSEAMPTEEPLEQLEQQRGAQIQQPQWSEAESDGGSAAGSAEGDEVDAWDGETLRSERGGHHGNPSTQSHMTTPRTHREGGSGVLTRRAAAEARRRGTVALLSSAAQTARVLRQSQVLQKRPPQHCCSISCVSVPASCQCMHHLARLLSRRELFRGV
jgi:hypothetical protein